MATLTANPSNTLKIKIQRVKKAYFAKKEIISTEKSGETYSYTFKGSNNTSTTARKEKIAGIIFKNITPKLKNNKQQTTAKQVVSALTKKAYKKGDCIDIPLVKEKIKFIKQPSANLGDKLYVVVETENMPDRKIKMNFKQGGDKKVLADKETAIFVTQENNNQASYLFTATVGEFAKQDTVINASDFKNFAITKIALQSSAEETNKKYKEALNKAEGKKAPFYIAMDAEPEENNWLSVKYEEVFDNRPNLWYYGEGNWFEFSLNKVYKKGDKGEDYGKILQEINIRLAGFGGNVPSEDFTERTEKTVIQFQKDYMKIEEPSGEVDDKTLTAIDEFGKKFDMNFEQVKCKCGTCTGFGKGLYSNEKQKDSIKERKRKYEYPGIHRSLFWALKAIQYYLSDKYSSYNLKFGKTSSGYRCHKDNSQHNRTSTNHMGKALDLHFYKLNSSNSTEVNCDKIRDLLILKSGAQLRWSGSDKFSLEPSTKDKKGNEFLATTWVHIDVREFKKEFLKDDFFIKTKDKITNTLI